jgi:predicted transcriptional regulator
MITMTQKQNVLVVTVGDEDIYEEGLEAIQRMGDSDPIDKPAVLSFADEEQLADVFDGHTYSILRVIRDEEPDSIRATARLVERDVKNVHQELTKLEALGVIRFEEEGRSKKPVFPYDDLLIRPFVDERDDILTDREAG